MANSNVILEIGDFLGFCDLNGVEALQSDQVEKLEEYISQANEARNAGDDLIPDAIWDRLMEILRQVNPDSELCKHIWEDSVDELDDTDAIVRQNPMFSIQTVKSFDCDEIRNFQKRLPDGETFTGHLSVKLNGHGIRLKYRNGKFFNARSRARSSAGRDITKQLQVVVYNLGLDDIPDLESFDLCEVRGEWLLPFANLEEARQHNPDIKSAFSGVASMGRDSATEEEWGLLHFVAYEFIAPDMTFQSKSEEYQFLEDMGFETPMYWLLEDMDKESLIETLKSTVADCESAVNPAKGGDYEYYTDGLVFAIDDTEFFRSLGDDGGHYKFGNMALKVGYWEQNLITGVVQTILWTQGKSKFSPVAIISQNEGDIIFNSGFHQPYIFDIKEISNWKDLGVVTQSGNRVRRIPLYEPSNMVALDAYPGEPLYFRYGGEAGVVPCFGDGTPLLDGRIKDALSNEDDLLAYEMYAD